MVNRNVRRVVRGFLVLAASVMLGLATMGSGCNPDCGDSCGNDEDCGGGLVCYSGQCAPEECRDHCSNVGINICKFNRLTCTYLSCD